MLIASGFFRFSRYDNQLKKIFHWRLDDDAGDFGEVLMFPNMLLLDGDMFSFKFV